MEDFPIDEEDFEIEEDAEENLRQRQVPQRQMATGQATQKTSVSKPPLTRVKQQVTTSSRTVKSELLGATPPNRENRAPLNQQELFIVRKRTEATSRDTACKAICKIKLGLRQPGAQDDGRPFIPEDWETNFKPTLGSYVKFLVSRPDQFRIIEGSGPGLYTVANATSNQVAVAADWDAVAKAKGKGKFKGKGKGKGKDIGKSKGKDMGKGLGKDMGKFQGKSFGKLQILSIERKGKGKGDAGSVSRPTRTPPTQAAAFLAEAAKDEWATQEFTEFPVEDYSEEFAMEDNLGEDIHQAEAGAEQGVETDRYEEEGGEFEMPAEYGEGEMPAEDGGEEVAGGEEGAESEFPAERATKHGSYIRSLLLGGGLLGSQKRPLANDSGASAAKRAR